MTKRWFIAADLLSQIEHGEKSISVLFCECQKIIKRVDDEIRSQIKDLSNYKLIQKLIKNIKLIHTDRLSESISYSNFFAPEHLIIQTKVLHNIIVLWKCPELSRVGPRSYLPFTLLK